MALAKFKALKEFDYNENHYAIGNEIILPDLEGDDLHQQGKVILMRYLDPEDATDSLTIKQFFQAGALDEDDLIEGEEKPKRSRKTKKEDSEE